MEQFCMNIRHEFPDFTPDKFYDYLDAYFRKLVCEGVTQKAVNDAQSHFYNWLKHELKNNKDENGETNRYGNTGSKRARETPNYDEDFHGNA